MFDRFDSNRDGTISREERRDARETLRGERRQDRRG
jgi:Ca2+-binding EF-hand superfamily protein